MNVKVDKLPDTYLCPWNNMYNYLSNSLLRAEDPLFPVTTFEFANVLSGCAEKAGIKSKLTPHAFRSGGADGSPVRVLQMQGSRLMGDGHPMLIFVM